MRRLVLIAGMLAACMCSAAQAASMRDLAPADEYFGRMKMSVLGIRNALDTLERRAAGGDRNVAAMSGQLAFIDDAMADWAAKYPRDSWLPRFRAARARIASMIALESGRRPFRGDSLIGVLGTIRR